MSDPNTPQLALEAIEEVSQVSSIQTGTLDPLTYIPYGNTPPPNAIYHAACGKWWTGMAAMHCSGCHRTFTGLTAFDKHRDGKHSDRRYCHHPIDVGLVNAGKSYECYGWPGNDDRWAAE